MMCQYHGCVSPIMLSLWLLLLFQLCVYTYLRRLACCAKLSSSTSVFSSCYFNLITEKQQPKVSPLSLINITLQLIYSEHREGENGDWNRSVNSRTNTTSHYTIDGLNPFTLYFFRVAARNALGYSRPSKESYPTMTHRERKSIFSGKACVFPVWANCINNNPGC